MAAGAWLTVTLLPATTIVALRLAPPLAATVTVAVPEPVLAPLTDAQAAPDEDVQAQVLDVVTVTLCEPAFGVKLSAAGDTV